ncbi:2337_t:CDS:10 [Ambispora gerdemannii]|uniref:RING-type E3 ubiquitin transferase n=1 Tax=Ambispora gerdemannii TaxID=144530 RepID=A0A9N8VSX7_9GLOM|nr:2337_t:CDS:10 [Ambispora gerdemannii]
MPDSIPVVLFLRRGLRRCYGLIKIWIRAMLVGTVWLITLPYITVWVWRFYFWSGDGLASFIYRRESISVGTANNNSTISDEKSALAVFYVNLLKSALWYAPPEAVEFVEAYGDFASSKFFADTFEGQIITCIVVIVFVAAFLLREWIIQNTPPEDGLENDGMEIEGIDNDLENRAEENAERRLIPAAVPPPPAPADNQREFDLQLPQLLNFEPNLQNMPQLPQLPNFEPILNLPNDPGPNNRPWPVLNIPPAPDLLPQPPPPAPDSYIFNERNPQFPENSSTYRALEQHNESEQLLDQNGENIDSFALRPSDNHIFDSSFSATSSSFKNIYGAPVSKENTQNDTASPESQSANLFYSNDKNISISALLTEVDKKKKAEKTLGFTDMDTHTLSAMSSQKALDQEEIKSNFLFPSDNKKNNHSNRRIRPIKQIRSRTKASTFSSKPHSQKINTAHSSLKSDPIDTSSSIKSEALLRGENSLQESEDSEEYGDSPLSSESEASSEDNNNGETEDNSVSGKSISPSKLIANNRSLYHVNQSFSGLSASNSSRNVARQMKWASDVAQSPSRRKLLQKSLDPNLIPFLPESNSSNWMKNEKPWFEASSSSLTNRHGGLDESSSWEEVNPNIIFEDDHYNREEEDDEEDDEEEDEYEEGEEVDDEDESESDDSQILEDEDDNEADDARDPEDILNVGEAQNHRVEVQQDANAFPLFPRQEQARQPVNAIWIPPRNNNLNNEPQQNNNDNPGVNQPLVNNAPIPPPINPVQPLVRRDPNQDPPVAPLFNEAIDAPVGGMQNFNQFGEADDEEENVANEDLEGVLEAIGMRGSLWMLIQNSALMALLIALCLGLSIWIPYIVGKLALLSNPFYLIQGPLWLLRRVTDPLVDLTIDTALPWIWSIISPILRSGWETSSPFVYPYLEDLAIVEPLQTVASKSWEYFLYAMSLTAQIAPTTSEKIVTNNATLISSENEISQLVQLDYINLAFKFIQRYNEFAYGNKPVDKIICIIFGYTIVILVSTWYLARTRNAYGRTVGRAVQEALRQQGIVLKVAFFVAIELIIFPIICGILLDFSTLPLFPDATPLTRFNFYLESPFTSIFLHWFIGTGFMFHFAVFVAVCREIVRPGVMWFIRDPNDPQFHPIKEILERPVLTQLKKIGASGIMYSAMIVFGLGSVIYFVRYAFVSILPLRWSLTEPISDFPLDLLVFHIVVPVTVDWAKPRELFRTLFEKWWHVAAQQLRLTSFMFGNRYPEEEGTHYRKTWRALLLGQKAPIPRLGIDTDNNNNEDQNAEVVFVKDGGFVRAPSFDGVPVVPGRRMLIPVTEQGALLDPNDAPVGEDDQLHHTVVYVPPSFKARVIFFLFLMWLCGSIFCCSVTILPLLIGRFIFQTLLHYQQPVHDLYAFTVGLYVMWTLGVGMEWTIRRFQILKEQRIWEIDWLVLRGKLVTGTRICSKILYLFVAFGIIMPFLFSLVIELYFILPWKKYSAEPQPISFLQDWALGIVYMKIAYRIVFMLPDNTFSRTINEITGRGIRNLDVKLATNMFILPIGGIGLVAVILPALNAWLILFVAGIGSRETQTLIFRLIYPLFLAFVVGYRIQRQATQLIQNWMQTVRDEEYRIGLRLHNIEPNEPATNVPVSSSSNTNNDDNPIPQNAG